jgi:hypothetical protein
LSNPCVADATKTAGVTFQAEALTTCWDEALPLMLANHRETGACAEWRFAPAKVKLLHMENAGFVRLFTARKNGKLIGYQLFFVLFGINYPDNIECTCHVAYVMPEYRSITGYKFLCWADEKLFYEGVYSIARQSTVKHPLDRLYTRMNYRKIEENWLIERGGDC